MDDRHRRILLQSIGSMGVVALSGCQGFGSEESSEGETPTSTEETTSNQSSGGTQIHFDLAATVPDKPETIEITGTIEGDTSLSTAVVTAGKASTEVNLEESTQAEIDVTLDVAAGTHYDVNVRTVTTDGAVYEDKYQTEYVPFAVDKIDTERLVGAHYYPWYEMHSGHENWTNRTVSEPVLGEYTSNNKSVIDRHLKWSLEHGIGWWSVSWWGEGSGSDRALQETILETDRFDDIEFSILYETVGRLEDYNYDMDTDAARDRLRRDFEYLEAEYFNQDNYLHIDDRPVVFFYVANNLRGDVENAFTEASATLERRPYVLAGLPFGQSPTAAPIADIADGVTSYNPYSPRTDIEAVFHDSYEQGNKILHLGSETLDADMVPVVIPGFNDTGLPARLREDNPILSTSPDRFERVCEQVNPHLNDSRAVLVTSFNEWYEDTQVEPDETHGMAYLDLVESHLASGSSSGFDPTGTRLKLEFNTAIRPDGSSRSLSFLATSLKFLADGEQVVGYDIGGDREPLYISGAYSPESDGNRSWRWFGGTDAEAELFMEADLTNADTMILLGEPMESGTIEATVSFDGQKLDNIGLGERDGTANEYRFSLS